MQISDSWHHYQPVKICSGTLDATLSTALQQTLKQANTDTTVLLVTTPGFQRRGTVTQLTRLLSGYRLLIIDSVTANPDVTQLDAYLQLLAGQPLGAVIGLGGGSALDTAKALALLQPIATAEECLLQQVFRLKTLSQPHSRLPLILIPTTAGTGSEVTPFATIWDNELKKKYSLQGDVVYPDTALLDATLTLSLPRDETLYSGLDALSHCLESLWNINRTPLSEAYAREGIRLLVQHLPNVLSTPDAAASRQTMQTASLLAGMAISITRTAIAHAISYPLTSYYGVPHGLACSFTLNALIKLVLSSEQLSDLAAPLQQAQALLTALPLRQHLCQFVTPNQIFQHQTEMFHPARAGNFAVPFDNTRLLQVLADSLQPV